MISSNSSPAIGMSSWSKSPSLVARAAHPRSVWQGCAQGRHGRRGMTYMGKPYYPVWLDNLADDVTVEAAAMDGTAHGPDDVRAIVGTARELYDQQEFRFAGP